MARKLAFDRVLFTAVLILTGLGLVMVYSSSAALARDRPWNPFFARQSLAAALGLGAMVAAMHIDYRWLRRRAVIYSLVLAVLALLTAALLGPSLNNAHRWLTVAGLSLQPSELAKLVLVLYIAYQIHRKEDRVDSFALLVPSVGLTLLLATLTCLGRDLGTTLLLVVPPFLMLFIAGLPLRHFLVGGALAIPAVALAVVAEPYRLRRVVSFFHPQADPLDSGFQSIQSLIAVGSGGLFGLGPGNSVQKLYFLPSAHADFIYSIVAEELGLAGALVVAALFGVLLWRGIVAGLGAPDTFSRYLAWGLTFLIVFQALIHLSVTLALLPATGVPLPLVSHGGSSLLVTLTACGLVLNVSQHRIGWALR